MKMGQMMLPLLVLFLSPIAAKAQGEEPLKLEKSIELPEVVGRIDHMSIDVKGQRLFVSALGNNTVEIIDLNAGKGVKTISGLREPQGTLFVPSNSRLFVASGQDGTVKIYYSNSSQLLKKVEYGDDADNLRYDSSRNRVYVGYGSGGLGELNAEGQKVAEIQLGSHPESFQLEKNSPRIYVNLPKARKVVVVDREARSVTASWNTGLSLANYAMALDETNGRLFVVTRIPARLLVIDTGSGKTIQTLSVVGDCDDIFYDQRRKRVYAIGGEGAISVLQQIDPDHYQEIARVPTAKGARTGFFSPDLDRLYLGVRRQDSKSAMIQVFKISGQHE